MIMSFYGASQCLNESSIRLYYTNKETNQGSLSSTKACQSCKEEVGAIIQHCAKTQCMHKPSCARTRDRTKSSSKRGARRARTRAISQHRVTSHCKRYARCARTRHRTTSSSKRSSRCVRIRDRTTSSSKRYARCARTRDRTTSSSKRGARRARTRAISQHRVMSYCKRCAR